MTAPDEPVYDPDLIQVRAHALSVEDREELSRAAATESGRLAAVLGPGHPASRFLLDLAVALDISARGERVVWQQVVENFGGEAGSEQG